MNAVRMLLSILMLVFTFLSVLAYLRKGVADEPFRADPNTALLPYGLPTASEPEPEPPLDLASLPVPPPDPAKEELERRPVSPYEIRRNVLEHKDDQELPEPYLRLDEFWLRLGIACEPWRGYDDCKVDLFKVSLTSGSRDDVLVRLYDDSGWSWGCRYLLFAAQRAGRPKMHGWRFLGYIDTGGSRYSAPDHEVVEAGRRHWLAIVSLGGHGSGFNLYSERLYDVTDNGLKEVLTFHRADISIIMA
jgi:hypothetical protein